MSGAELQKLMLEARLSLAALSRKSSLPLDTVKRAVTGKALSPVLIEALKKVCEEEINAGKRS